MSDLLTGFGLIAVVLTIAALTSGLVARAPVSSPMIFLALGFLLGEHGLGVLRIGPHSAVLEVVAVLSLSFVLFLDAIRLRFDEMGKDWLVPVLALGPGTILTVLLIAGAAALLLALPPIQAVLLGAVLSSVDPVVLRDVVRDKRIPRSVRRALQTEAGTNDLVVLPIILVAAAVALGQTGGAADWLVLLGRLFLLGPLVGLAVGAAYVWLMRQARAHTPISSEYRAIGGVGTLLAAYVAGEAAGSSGFLAVFAAGVAVVALDYDVCDCFLDFGAIMSELVMLLAFILFGAMLSTAIGTVPLLPSLLFAGVVLVIARPVAIGLVLWRAPISGRGRRFIGWFGPRGLSSLLFGLLLVADGVPGAEQLLALAGVVVIVSVIAHGVSAAPLAERYARAVARATLAEEREATAAGLFHRAAGAVPRITPAELAARLASDAPPLVLDVRSRSSYDHDRARIPGSVRVPPDEVTEWAAGQPRGRPVVAYCT
ncbi:MAG TPA: cation:proton antiporter [Chloroflexota bacterium]|nr:cation:proton antiporter [Chloroflexota bacterium]